MDWHYSNGADRKGPISDADLATLAASGAINESTLVWREGMPEWQTYGQVKGATSVPTAVATPPVGVVCAECGRTFATSDVIRHGNAYICADCKPVFVQKLKEGITPRGQLNYAGFGVRGGSIILDGIIIWAVTFPLNLLNNRLFGRGAAIVAVNFLANVVLAMSYYVFFLGKFGATLGKMANKLLVVNPDGSKISYAKAFGRYFAANWLSGIFSLFIGYLVAIWDDEKRALHDRICGTRVIRK